VRRRNPDEVQLDDLECGDLLHARRAQRSHGFSSLHLGLDRCAGMRLALAAGRRRQAVDCQSASKFDGLILVALLNAHIA
jgi:hypothetical protein